MNLQNLLSILVMHRHNLQMIHWNVVGPDFLDVHTTLDDYISQVTGDIDKIAEFAKMLNYNAKLPSFLELEGILKNDSMTHIMIESSPVEASVAWKAIKDIFNDILSCMEEARKEMPPDIQSEFDSSMYFYRREANYKCAATLNRGTGSSEVPSTGNEPESEVIMDDKEEDMF